MKRDVDKIAKLLKKRKIFVETVTEVGKYTVLKINNGMEMVPLLFSKDTGELVRIGNPFEMPGLDEHIPF